MNRIKLIAVTASSVTIIGTLISLIFPGWRFSIGVFVGGIVGLIDFWMIVGSMSILKLADKNTNLMARFALTFMMKTFGILALLAIIIFILSRLSAVWTVYGFICGLAVIPLAIFITAIRGFLMRKKEPKE